MQGEFDQQHNFHYLLGHVHKCEAELWTLEKLRKAIFCQIMINFSLRELKFSGNLYFSYTKRLALAKVEKVIWLQRNDKKVILLLICHISGFQEKYFQELPYKQIVTLYSFLKISSGHSITI